MTVFARCSNCGLDLTPYANTNTIVTICPRCGSKATIPHPDAGRQPDTVIVDPNRPITPNVGNGAAKTVISGAGNAPAPTGPINPNPIPPGHGATRIIRPEMLNFNGIGGLLMVETGEFYPLKEGSNVIGRKAKSGTADIKMSDDKYMSRRHVQIDVTKDQFGRYAHRVIEINSTNVLKLNGQPVDRGKLLLLHLDDELTLGRTKVRFVAKKP